MIVSMYAGWPLTKLEIADGFYPPWCATVRYVIDHFAVGVFVSFTSVCVAHAIFWGDFISGGLQHTIAKSPRTLLQVLCRTYVESQP